MGLDSGLNPAAKAGSGLYTAIERYGVATVFATILLVYTLWLNSQVMTQLQGGLKSLADSQSAIARVQTEQTTVLQAMRADLSGIRAGVRCLP